MDDAWSGAEKTDLHVLSPDSNIANADGSVRGKNQKDGVSQISFPCSKVIGKGQQLSQVVVKLHR